MENEGKALAASFARPCLSCVELEALLGKAEEVIDTYREISSAQFHHYAEVLDILLAIRERLK